MYCSYAHASDDAATGVTAKKRKLAGNAENCFNRGDNQENHFQSMDQRFWAGQSTCPPGRRFLHLRKEDCDTIFQTEDWQMSGTALFIPLTEDLLINTRNIEQFSCSRGDFFVAGLDGVYSKTLSGDVLHLWRFCEERKRLFISRSFLFKNPQDILAVQHILQQL